MCAATYCNKSACNLFFLPQLSLAGGVSLWWVLQLGNLADLGSLGNRLGKLGKLAGQFWDLWDKHELQLHTEGVAGWGTLGRHMLGAVPLWDILGWSLVAVALLGSSQDSVQHPLAPEVVVGMEH